MDKSTRDTLNAIAALVGVGTAVVSLVVAVKRLKCPCCGTSLPFLGDAELFGTRYCPSCDHNH